jgi:hypothetical protein
MISARGGQGQGEQPRENPGIREIFGSTTGARVTEQGGQFAGKE